MRKAQSNMWFIVVAAVLAVIVLIVLVIFFGSGTDKVATGLSECEGKLGSCEFPGDCKGSVTKAFECADGKECCINLKSALT